MGWHKVSRGNHDFAGGKLHPNYGTGVLVDDQALCQVVGQAWRC